MEQVIKLFLFCRLFSFFLFVLFLSFFLVIMNCKYCKIKMLYLGSKQNGFFYLCKKCNNVMPINEEIKQK